MSFKQIKQVKIYWNKLFSQEIITEPFETKKKPWKKITVRESKHTEKIEIVEESCEEKQSSKQEKKGKVEGKIKWKIGRKVMSLNCMISTLPPLYDLYVIKYKRIPDAEHNSWMTLQKKLGNSGKRVRMGYKVNKTTNKVGNYLKYPLRILKKTR